MLSMLWQSLGDYYRVINIKFAFARLTLIGMQCKHVRNLNLYGLLANYLVSTNANDSRSCLKENGGKIKINMTA